MNPNERRSIHCDHRRERRNGLDGWGRSGIDGKGHEAFLFIYIGRLGQAYQHYTGNTKGDRRSMWCWDLGIGGLVELMGDFSC